MQLTIKKLRQAGFKVRVIHTRHHETVNQMRMSGPYTRLSGKGGRTKIEVTTPDMAITAAAEAECSLQDSFNRKLGNSIALGRVAAKLSQFDYVKELLEKL